MIPQLLTINLPTKQSKNIRIEINPDQFERLAADLGFFQKEFLESVTRAEREITQGKTKRLRSLRDLRSSS